MPRINTEALLLIGFSSIIISTNLVFGKLFVTHANTSFDPEYSIFNIALNYDKQNDASTYNLDVDFEVNKRVNHVIYDVQIFRISPTSINRMMSVVRRTVNLCGLLKGAITEKFIKFVHEQLVKTGKIPLRCPIEPVKR